MMFGMKLGDSPNTAFDLLHQIRADCVILGLPDYRFQAAILRCQRYNAPITIFQHKSPKSSGSELLVRSFRQLTNRVSLYADAPRAGNRRPRRIR